MSLLTVAIDLDFTNKVNPLSPLAIAIKNGHYEVAAELVAKGASFIMPEK